MVFDYSRWSKSHSKIPYSVGSEVSGNKWCGSAKLKRVLHPTVNYETKHDWKKISLLELINYFSRGFKAKTKSGSCNKTAWGGMWGSLLCDMYHTKPPLLFLRRPLDRTSNCLDYIIVTCVMHEPNITRTDRKSELEIYVDGERR